MDSAEDANLSVVELICEECNAGMEKRNISSATP